MPRALSKKGGNGAQAVVLNCMGSPVWYLGDVSATEIVEQIRKLPPDVRREVVEQLRDEFAELSDDLIPEQAAELERRADDALKHPGRGKPAEQVFTEIRDRLGAKK